MRLRREAHLTNTVLVVDTSDLVVNTIAQALSSAGYDPSGANSYQAAGRQLEVSAPDVLVVSVELAAHNGIQLAMRCSRAHPTTQVIVMGPKSAALEREACSLGASAYMSRPLTPGALIKQLKSISAAAQRGLTRPPGEAHAGSGLAATA
jgi:DNA-binding NtrC family response regulator